MDGQLSFASLDYAAKKKRTKRDVFLAEMAAMVPWAVLEAVIEPHYPKQGPQGGRRAFPLAVMLRIYCLQQWYRLSDPGAEEALYDIQSMRAFCGLELGRDPIPDETTILNFRHLLEAHGLTKTVFEAVAEYLEARGAPSNRRSRVAFTFTTNAGRASSGSRKAKARSSGRGCHAERSPPTRCGSSFMRSPTTSAISCGLWRRRSRSRTCHDELEGEADQDRREGGEPRTLHEYKPVRLIRGPGKRGP